MNPKPKLYIGFIGDAGSGKSQIINRYIREEFTQEYQKNIGLSFSIFETAEPNEYSVSVIEFSSNEKAFELFKDQINLIQCFVLVFDLSDPNSHKSVEKYLPLIRNKDFICFGTKSDIAENPEEMENDFQQKYNVRNFLIGSAAIGYNIDDLFCRAVNMIEDKYNLVPGNNENALVKTDQPKSQRPEAEQKKDSSTATSQCCLLI